MSSRFEVVASRQSVEGQGLNVSAAQSSNSCARGSIRPVQAKYPPRGGVRRLEHKRVEVERRWLRERASLVVSAEGWA